MAENQNERGSFLGRFTGIFKNLLGIFRPNQNLRASKTSKVRLPAVVPAANASTLIKQTGPIKRGARSSRTAGAMSGGRQTIPVNYNPVGLSMYHFIYRREYQDIDISNLNVGDYEATQLLTILADVSPDVSRAVWNVLRVAGTNLTFQVVDLAGEDDIKGQAIVDDIVSKLNIQYGGMKAIIIQLLLSAYIEGAICLEVAPTFDLTDVMDIYPVNPGTIYFQRDENQIPIPFQRQPIFWAAPIRGGSPSSSSGSSKGPVSNGYSSTFNSSASSASSASPSITASQTTFPFRRLNQELFFYTPIDAFVDDVYGRPPLASVLQIVFFQKQVLEDLQRVIHTQGWPKIDISVITEILMEHVPDEYKEDPEQVQIFIEDRLDEIISAYNSMSPEDAYIHPDYVEISSDSAKAGTGMFNFEGLLRVIRAQLISAMKQLPVLMGEHMAGSEAFSGIELSIFSKGVEVFREPVGDMLAKALETSLQLRGYLATVKALWPAIQVSSRMQAALAEAQEAANQVYYRDQGWITQDQASKVITGSNAVEEIPPIHALQQGSLVGQIGRPGSGSPTPPRVPNAGASGDTTDK